MKSSYYFLLLSLFALLLLSCRTDVTDMGSSIQPEEDKITIKVDTFHLTSQNLFIDSIHNRADSLLLGTYIDHKYGTVHADILARIEAPFDSTGFRYPDDAEVDSAFLILSYQSWFGAENSTMSVKAYEMNKDSILDYYTYYPSNAAINNFVDLDNPSLLGGTVFTVNDTVSINSINIRLINDVTNNFFVDSLFKYSKDFTNENKFFEKFNGLYITPNIGDATMIYLRGINILLYYKYNTTVAGIDTTFVNTTSYVVNNTVINRFQHPDRDQIKANLAKEDSINYVSSPANIYTQINVPLKKIVEQMQDSIGINKKLIVNSAIIKVEAKDTDNESELSDLALPLPSGMLLMKKEDMNNFFTQERSTTDSIVHASYNSTDSCYSFNIATYIDREIRRSPKNEDGKILISNDLEEMEMVLVPVRITTSSDSYGNTTISSIKQQVLMSGVTLRSGKDENRPMKINLLYSGF